MSSGDSGQSQISLRYAAALLDLAEESKVLNAVEGDLHNIKAMIASCDDLSRLLRSPVLSRENQGKALAAVLDKAKIGDLTKRFVAVVAGNHRLLALPTIIDAFFALLTEKRGEMNAEVTSAKDLSSAQITSLEAALTKIDSSGKDVSAIMWMASRLADALAKDAARRCMASRASSALPMRAPLPLHSANVALPAFSRSCAVRMKRATASGNAPSPSEGRAEMRSRLPSPCRRLRHA